MTLMDTSSRTGVAVRKLGWIDGKFQDTLTVLDEMIFGQRLETAGSNEALGEHDPSSDGDLPATNTVRAPFPARDRA